MKKLVSSNEAASILGLSLQGIHYRIKKGQLESIKKDGKIFVYIDENSTKTQQTATIKDPTPNNYKELEEKILSSKDEQIHLLKKTIKFMKKQYTSEIDRLDKNQSKVLEVFQSEVDLLKSAFNEMRNIYKLDHQEQKSKEHKAVVKNEISHTHQMKFLDVKDFFLLMKKHNKSNREIKSIILEKVKQGDKRFIYNKNTNEIIIYKSDFLDII
ncbi:MAG: DNA-binding protein [Arcobacteraceae bacterium]